MNAARPMYAAGIAALLCLFNAAPAAAQSPPPLVTNNTAQALTCSSKFPDGEWQAWFEMAPAANWTGASGSQEILFQCRPPVAQVSYALKPGQRYSLLPSDAGITLVEVGR